MIVAPYPSSAARVSRRPLLRDEIAPARARRLGGDIGKPYFVPNRSWEPRAIGAIPRVPRQGSNRREALFGALPGRDLLDASRAHIPMRLRRLNLNLQAVVSGARHRALVPSVRGASRSGRVGEEVPWLGRLAADPHTRESPRTKRSEDPHAGSKALRFVGHQVESLGHSAELGKRTGLHLLHCPAAMHLHRGLGNTDIEGNLFAEAAARNLDHDLALPGAERGEAFPEVRQSLFILSPRAVARKAELNGVEEFLIAERLCQELNGTPFHRLHRHRDVAVPRDEDDREFPVCYRELAL